MKDCTNLVEILKETVPDVPREFSSIIINGVSDAANAAAAAVRNYGSVYGQNQMLEYSTDGKISDVTATFSGRTAVSDSVLADLHNRLTQLKNNYDKAWEILPATSESFTETITAELSASFAVATGAKAPSTGTDLTSTLNAQKASISLWEHNARFIGTLEFDRSNTGVLTGRAGSDFQSLTIGQFVVQCPGTIILNPAGAHLTAFTMLKPPNDDVTAFIMVVNTNATIFLTFNGHTTVHGPIQTGSLLNDLSKLAAFNFQVTGEFTFKVPEVLDGAHIISDSQSANLTYSVPAGDSIINVSQQVSKDVDYTVTYNTIPNETSKIQAIIDAIP